MKTVEVSLNVVAFITVPPPGSDNNTVPVEFNIELVKVKSTFISGLFTVLVLDKVLVEIFVCKIRDTLFVVPTPMIVDPATVAVAIKAGAYVVATLEIKLPNILAVAEIDELLTDPIPDTSDVEILVAVISDGL